VKASDARRSERLAPCSVRNNCRAQHRQRWTEGVGA